jgi:hypothetical protein
MPFPSQGLDGPPPSPAGLGVGTGGSPSPPPMGYAELAPAGVTPQVLQQILQQGQQADQMLVAFAQVLPAGAAEFRQAQQAMQLGFAKALQAGSPAVAPTAVGGQFPGGGFGGGIP